jgi:hypothetical protein
VSEGTIMAGTSADPFNPKVGETVELKAPWGLVRIESIDARWVKFCRIEDGAIITQLDELKERFGGEIPPQVAALENPPMQVKRRFWRSKVETEG